MKTVFLDRDGVINQNVPNCGYVMDWKDFVFIPGARDAIRHLTQSGYRIIILTNQAGIGRGLTSEQQVMNIHDQMVTQIAERGGKIRAVYYCPHAPDDKCGCRKPKPGMLIRAAREHEVEVSSSYFIGDSLTDIAAGKTAGAPTILVLTGHGKASYRRYIDSIKSEEMLCERQPAPDKIFTDLYAAACWLQDASEHKIDGE